MFLRYDTVVVTTPKGTEMDPERLLEMYLDALNSLSPDDFETGEAFYTAQNIWSEVTDDIKRIVSHGPFTS